jgi:hypothetical protein
MSYQNDDYLEIDLEFKFGTPESFLLTDGDVKVWIPCSQIKDAKMWHHYVIGYNYTWEIKQWVLLENGLI